MRRMIKETEISKLDAINTNDLAKLGNISEADIQRLNNITDADVARLNKLTDNDVNKIQSITNADIQSVKAMESPKNATADYVLTADGTGKATYKPAQGGSGGLTSCSLNISDQQYGESYCDFHSATDDISPATGFSGWFYFDIPSPDSGSFLDCQLVYIQGPNTTLLVNKLISDSTLVSNPIVTYPNSTSCRIFIDESVATALGISDGSSCNVRYAYRKIELWCY